MMKKIILTSLCFFLFNVSFFANANECSQSCKIQDGPASVIEDYLENLNTVVQNTLKSAKGEKTTSGAKKIQQQLIAELWKLTDFWEYFSSFDYYVTVPITNEIPQEIKRDHDLLDKESERLQKILEKVIRSGYANSEVENPCEWVQYCDERFEGTVSGILTQLIKNNKEIVSYYRLSIIDKRSYGNTNFMLVPDTFEWEIGANYNKDTLADCSLCDGGFFDKVKTSIENIGANTSQNNEWLRKWKEAWALLTGAVGQSNYTKEEERILKEHLWKENLNSSSADTVTDNLARFNSGWLSTSNPFFNSANYTFSKAKDQVDTFANSLDTLIDTDQEKIPIVAIEKSVPKVKTSDAISQEISALYGEMIPFVAVQDTKNEQIIAKLLRMHYSLVRSINILDKNVRVAEEVCDSQWQGLGNCNYR